MSLPVLCRGERDLMVAVRDGVAAQMTGDEMVWRARMAGGWERWQVGYYWW